MKKIYLAGGWFTPEQEEEHTRIYNLIKDKFDVFNPKLAGIIGGDTTKDQMSQILLGNIEGIRTADIVLVIYDYKDTGTIWESGFAYGCTKPIVYYAEKLNGKSFNVMLAKTGHFAANEEELMKLLEDEDTYHFSSVVHSYEGKVN